MLAKERQDEIVERVNTEGSVRVKELSERYGVTEDSIRKDLTLLERKGLLKKTYGGAVRVRVNSHDLYVSARRDQHLEEKRTIARKAFSLLRKGELLYLDISTANLELARLILDADLPVTIITSMIDILMLFHAAGASRSTKLIFIGGVYSPEHGGFVDTLASQEIARYHVDRAFLGVVGVDAGENRVETYQAEDGMTKQVIMRSADRTYMLLESRKLGSAGNYQYARISDFTGAITEKDPKELGESLTGRYPIEWI